MILFFLWIIIVIFLFNKTHDFYKYFQLLYNFEWLLDLCNEFVKLSIIKKFEQVKINNKILKFFNFLHIQHLTTKKHIDAALVTLTILILLQHCMIRWTDHIKICEKKISKLIFWKHINFIVMIFNYIKQLEYCEIHFKNTKTFLKFTVLNENDELKKNKCKMSKKSFLHIF